MYKTLANTPQLVRRENICTAESNVFQAVPLAFRHHHADIDEFPLAVYLSAVIVGSATSTLKYPRF